MILSFTIINEDNRKPVVLRMHVNNIQVIHVDTRSLYQPFFLFLSIRLDELYMAPSLGNHETSLSLHQFCRLEFILIVQVSA